MELDELMSSLSLSAEERHSAKTFKVFSVEIEGHNTDIVYAEFDTKFMVVVTQYGKLGALFRVTIDEVPNSETRERVYSVSCMFGAQDIEHQAAARYLAERLKIDKPLMLFLCLKDYSQKVVVCVGDAIANHPHLDSAKSQ